MRSVVIGLIVIFISIISTYFFLLAPGKGPSIEDISWIDSNYEYILSSRDESTFVPASWDLSRDYFDVSKSCDKTIRENIKNIEYIIVGKDKLGGLVVMGLFNDRYYIYGKRVFIPHFDHMEHVTKYREWDVWLKVRN